jgi:hypothetical protein
MPDLMRVKHGTDGSVGPLALARPAGHSKDGPCERDDPIPLKAAHISSHCTRGHLRAAGPLFEVMARAAARNQLDAASTERAP